MKLFYRMFYPCDKVRDFMYDYLEGRLPMAAAIRFHLHLNGCEECRRYLFLYRTAANAERFRKENPPPEEFLSETLDFLRKEGIVGDAEDSSAEETPR
jgi:predicted anti-sigma-YlaC factor YlaD